MEKKSLIEKLITQQNKAITELETKIADIHSNVDVDESDTIDPEDLSNQSVATEEELLFKQQLAKAKADLKTLLAIDFSTKSHVEPGAYVKTEKFNFLVGCATIPFDFEGNHIVGISTESPIYKEMKGLKNGDAFSVSGNEYLIKEIN